MDVKTVVKESKITGVLTNAQALLIQKQLQRIVDCEGGEIDKDWDTKIITLHLEGGIPWSKWCTGCLHRFEVIKSLMQKMMDKNSKAATKDSNRFEFRIIYSVGEN